MRLIAFPLIASALCLGMPAGARDQPWLDEPEIRRDGIVDGAPWQEGGAVMPPFPEDADLVEFSVDDPGSPFHYFVDTRNLSVGDDGVVRYTLVIKSRTGASNVSYEGIRCDSREYKIYAFGSGRGKLKPLRDPKWQPVHDYGPSMHAKDLREFYFCRPDRHKPYALRDILHRLDSAPRRSDDTGSLLPGSDILTVAGAARI